MNSTHKLLPQVAFSILLALSLRPRHGYQVMKQVESDSDRRIKLGPGALYGSLKTLNEQGLVEEIDDPSSSRRRLYQLTDSGRLRLSAELNYFETALELARQRQTVETTLGALV
jgi:DNA-binding PadR family transcriptional regulator